MKTVTIQRKLDFCAAHKLYNESWDNKKNMEVFGKCSNPNFHGHNYRVWVSLRGPVDPATGMVYNLTKLKEILKNQIEQNFDHKNLNLEVGDFKDLIPTAENIAIVIFEKLKKELGDLLYAVKLQETPNNIVEYCPEDA